MKWNWVSLLLWSGTTAAFISLNKAAPNIEENVSASSRPTNVTGLVVIGGIDKSSPVNNVSFLDPKEPVNSENRWTALSAFPMSLYYHAAATADPSTVYVAGGLDYRPNTKRRLPYLHRYDARDDSWTMRKSMPETRHRHGLTFVNGFLYATGGYTNSSGETNSVLKYDPSADTWSEVTDMNHSCSSCPAVSVGDKIYVLGGSVFTVLGEVQSYDTLTDKWTLTSPIPKPRIWAAACVVDGIIYLIGGRSPPDFPERNATQRYDPATDTWTLVAPMSNGRSAHACASYGQYIYVFGGEGDDGERTDSVEKYDTISDEWTDAGTMPYAPSTFAAVSLHLP